MTIALLFWVLMLFMLLYGLAIGWPRWGTPDGRWGFFAAVLWWVLIGLLGTEVFGPALRT